MDDKILRARKLCLGQARGFIAAAERLDGDTSFTHIVYHLALLALEEVGKAGLITARSVTRRRRDSAWIDKSLDNHLRKLLWALWSPVERIDPRDFEEARQFAERAHARRLSSLYVDVESCAPGDGPIGAEEASTTLSLARTRLELEESRGIPSGENDDLLDWFLDTMSDEQRSQRLLSKRFVARYHELGCDARAWIGWSRDEFERLEREASELLQTEIARPAVSPIMSKPRWEATLTVYTPSHSLRAKVLARWNERNKIVQLLWSNKKDQFTLRIALNNSISLKELPGHATSIAKIAVACLNIGTIGYFWFQRAGFEQPWFKELNDLENPDMLLMAGQIESFWGTGRAVALTEKHIDHATHCMMAFAPLPERDALPIFKPYFDGLAFIAKSDIFYSLDELARRAFIASLAGALRQYGDWDGKQESFESAYHAAFLPFMPDIEHRERMFLVLTQKGNPSESPLTNLRSAKQLADLYLIHVATREWHRRVEAMQTESDKKV